ncbi:MAG: thioredoxin family protein [Rhodobacteraceae bacterium]|nr:thioredoxin family protein [Paracoccaceae bacterium]
MAVMPPVCNFGWRAPGFHLPGVDGRRYRFDDIAGPKGTLVMFICNHCPYVLAVLDRIIRDARDLQALGIGVAAISANDALAYPQDSFENMKVMAAERGFPFPYLYDEAQGVARAYDAACTPDFFGFDAEGGLQYRGRLDASCKEAGAPDLKRELFEAMKQVAETGHGPREQIPSMGCSIKWKAA